MCSIEKQVSFNCLSEVKFHWGQTTHCHLLAVESSVKLPHWEIMLHQQVQEIDPVHCSELSSTGRFYSPKSLLLMKESSKVWGRDFSSSCPFQASDIWCKNEALETFWRFGGSWRNCYTVFFHRCYCDPEKRKKTAETSALSASVRKG